MNAIFSNRAAAAALAGLLATAGAARAQVAQTPLLDQYLQAGAGGNAFQPGVTVTSRARPDYDSSGVQLGNFTIRPQLTESTGYDSNVLGTSHPHGSAVIETNAAVDAAGDWSDGSARASLSVDDVRYPSQSRQSTTNWAAQLGATHEFGTDVASVGYSHLVLTETPGGLDVPQLQQPLPFSIDVGRIEYRANFARMFLAPALEVAAYDFGTSMVAGTMYQQSYRNRVAVTPSLTAGYELSPQRDVVVVLRNSEADYTHPITGLPQRDYSDTALLVGLDYDADAVIRFRVLAGYEVRVFRSSQYKTMQAPVAEASAIWTPTGLTTLTGTVARRIQDSADESTAGYTESYAQLRVDHEYLPNVLLHGNVGAYFTQYGGGGGTQSLYTIGKGITYQMNRNVQLGVSYDFTVRNSRGNGAFGLLGPQSFGSSYNDHRVMLQVRLRL